MGNLIKHREAKEYLDNIDDKIVRALLSMLTVRFSLRPFLDLKAILTCFFSTGFWRRSCVIGSDLQKP